MQKDKIKEKQYYLDGERFCINDYNHAPAFTNFFPAIAGLWGVPMWVFYVNRGQCISSFGIEGKDKAILEFHPANRAYRQTALQGFRTLIKIKEGKKFLFYEPFRDGFEKKNIVKNTMAVTSHDLTIEEVHEALGLVVRVNYFTLPEEPFAALVRRVSVENISKKNRQIEIIDGLPAIIPFGFNEWLLKHMSRTSEAWNQVSLLKEKTPYYNLKVVISDKPHVAHISAGNFYFSFSGQGKAQRLLEPVVQSSCVFGESHDFTLAENFFAQTPFKLPAAQMTANVTSSAMSFSKMTLRPKSKEEIISVFGHASHQSEMRGIVSKALSPDYIAAKADRNREIIEEIKNFALTSSASRAFDLYCGQTFLDNVLRGGLPISLETSEGKIALNVFTRKHGDPERDYNQFLITPTYLSQGNGSYRDVNQNRRNDVWFNDDVKDSNITNFLNLLQADGYNPLVIKGMTFVVHDAKKAEELLKDCVEGRDHIKELLLGGFLPGKLLAAVTQKNIKLKTSAQEFLKRVLSCSHKNESAEHGEGFWIDHWTYNLDLIESFLSRYPEARQNLLLEKKTFHFYHDKFHILPRSERYVLTPQGCRQYHSVGDAALKGAKGDNKLRAQNGSGPVYQTNLLVKLLCLVANKAATLDPSGIGIEMEADKPNWYDALNGLPGLLGSSTCETFELKRLCLFLLDAIDILSLPDDDEVRVFEELHAFITDLSKALENQADALVFWMKSNDAKEQYRARILQGISGQEKTLFIGTIKKFLQSVIEKANKAIDLAKNEKGLYASYFIHEVTEYEKLSQHNHDGFAYVKPLVFKAKALPIFLEGFVHALRIEKGKGMAKQIYQSVRKSPLFDKKLKMYRVNADLSNESEDIGRARIFPPGWLENGSIWLHMEYKFLLEILRCGLYKEFYENLKSAFVPFLDAKMYGRSILENSSFLVSSAHEDKSLHGRGFVARLSGTTAELIHIWLLMNAGENPFFLDKDGKLSLEFKPVLEGWLFTKNENTVKFLDKNRKWQDVILPKNTYAFNFLGSTLVVYHNPKRQNTFGSHKASVKKVVITYFNGRQATVSSSVIPSLHASDIRDGKASRIDIFLG